jgi:hypothetical protein
MTAAAGLIMIRGLVMVRTRISLMNALQLLSNHMMIVALLKGDSRQTTGAAPASDIGNALGQGTGLIIFLRMTTKIMMSNMILVPELRR